MYIKNIFPFLFFVGVTLRNVCNNLCDCCDCCEGCCDYEYFFKKNNIKDDHSIINEDVFIDKCKTKFLEICPKDVKNIKEDIPEERKNDYFSMYNDMVNDIFLSEVALKLMAYRELLRRIGIVDALKKIFADPNKITYYPSIYPINGEKVIPNRFFLKKNEDGVFEVVLLTTKAKIEKINVEGNDVKILGGIYVNDKQFRGLRCSGCEDKDCVSCLLFNLLKSFEPNEKRYENKNGYVKDDDRQENTFEELFYMQASDSACSRSLKKIIFTLLKIKNENINSNFFIKEKNEKTAFDNIKDTKIYNNTENFFYIEWAITIELLKILSRIVYDSDNMILYRTVDFNHLEKEYKNRRDFFESTSLLCPAYANTNFGKEQLFSCRYIKFPNVPIYRCIFNYIISTQNFSLFSVHDFDFDYEQEIGCITIGLNYEEMFDEETVEKAFKTSFLNENGGENEINFFGTGKKIFWYRQKFLIEQFMETLKKNIKKTSNEKKIKKIIFPKHFYIYDDCYLDDGLVKNGVGDRKRTNFCFFNDEYSIEFEE